MRELDRQLASIMRYQAKELALKEKVKTVLGPDDIEQILGKPRYSNDIYKIANMAGVAIGPVSYTHLCEAHCFFILCGG